jgi:hypothetical protein
MHSPVVVDGEPPGHCTPSDSVGADGTAAALDRPMNDSFDGTLGREARSEGRTRGAPGRGETARS